MSDGTIVIASKVGNPARVYSFLGAKVDPTRIMFTPGGKPAVVLKPTTAGP